jgi:hypothetical protein
MIARPSSHPSDGLPVIKEPNSIELRTIAHRDEPVSKDEDVEDDNLVPSARRASIDSAQSYELYTPDEDRAVLRKLDQRLVAFMALLYCLSFLDRSSEWFQYMFTLLEEDLCVQYVRHCWCHASLQTDRVW